MIGRPPDRCQGPARGHPGWRDAGGSNIEVRWHACPKPGRLNETHVHVSFTDLTIDAQDSRTGPDPAAVWVAGSHVVVGERFVTSALVVTGGDLTGEVGRARRLGEEDEQSTPMITSFGDHGCFVRGKGVNTVIPNGFGQLQTTRHQTADDDRGGKPACAALGNGPRHLGSKGLTA